jgi:hypothetical protein
MITLPDFLTIGISAISFLLVSRFLFPRLLRGEEGAMGPSGPPGPEGMMGEPADNDHLRRIEGRLTTLTECQKTQRKIIESLGVNQGHHDVYIRRIQESLGNPVKAPAESASQVCATYAAPHLIYGTCKCCGSEFSYRSCDAIRPSNLCPDCHQMLHAAAELRRQEPDAATKMAAAASLRQLQAQLGSIQPCCGQCGTDNPGDQPNPCENCQEQKARDGGE